MSLADIYSIATFNALKVTTILFAVVIGMIVPRWKWAIAAAASFATIEYIVLATIAVHLFGFGQKWSISKLEVVVADFGSILAAYLFWTSISYLLKQAIRRQLVQPRQPK
jgi:hypothetical protein